MENNSNLQTLFLTFCEPKGEEFNTFICSIFLWIFWHPWERVYIDLNKNIVQTGCVIKVWKQRDSYAQVARCNRYLPRSAIPFCWMHLQFSLSCSLIEIAFLHNVRVACSLQQKDQLLRFIEWHQNTQYGRLWTHRGRIDVTTNSLYQFSFLRDAN